MKSFAQLFAALDATNKTGRKLEVLSRYFASVRADDGAWAVFFLSGRRIKRVLPSARLRDWGAEAAGVPGWLFDESYHAVGDFAETVSLLLPRNDAGTDLPLHHWVEDNLLRVQAEIEAEQKRLLFDAWRNMNQPERLVWNKIITGEFRVGVSQRMVVLALAQTAGLDASVIAHRLMGDWQPTPEFFASLMHPDVVAARHSQPYPFFLAHALDADPASLGDLSDWQAEWKWDGIRAQLIRREGQTFLWSRGEELVTDRYPEIISEAARLKDGTVLDGEIVAWKNGQALPFADLQRRIGRKNLSKRMLKDIPACFLAFDLLEQNGQDLRSTPLSERRRLLEALTTWHGAALQLAPLIDATTWDELAARRLESRSRGVEGVMLKRRDSVYGVGRERGPWWKWKIEPYHVDAVLVYAQLGHGRRASLFTDYTFAVWDNGELVPFAKAYSGLSDEEIRDVDRFVRGHTIEKFGPVRQVQADLVFEIAFERIQLSTRHKSGVAVRFPRIARWRHDKKPQDADTLETLRGLTTLTPRPRKTDETLPSLFDLAE